MVNDSFDPKQSVIVLNSQDDRKHLIRQVMRVYNCIRSDGGEFRAGLGRLMGSETHFSAACK